MTTADERQTSGSSEAVAAVSEEARQTYRQSVAAELPLSGKALGSMFDRSESWGRSIIRSVKEEDSAAALPQNGSDSGNLLVKAPTADAVEPHLVEVLPAPVAAAVADTAQGRPTKEGSKDGATIFTAAAADERQTDSVAAAAAAAARERARLAWLKLGEPEKDETETTVTAAVLWSSRVSVVVVAVVAAAVSYEHMRSLADRTGEGWLAWLLPLSVDGLMVAASMVMLVRRRQGRPVGFLAWAALIGGVAASLAANVGASLLPENVTPDPWIKATVAAWPPIALLLAYELLMQLVRDARRKYDGSE